jgi:hypothetical protein
MNTGSYVENDTEQKKIICIKSDRGFVKQARHCFNMSVMNHIVLHVVSAINRLI